MCSRLPCEAIRISFWGGGPSALEEPSQVPFRTSFPCCCQDTAHRALAEARSAEVVGQTAVCGETYLPGLPLPCSLA